jgi:hypothetical protein
MLRMAYTFCYGLMIKAHESMFGLICYGLLLSFSCLDFVNTLGILSFIFAFLLLAYLVFISVKIY